MIAGSGLSGGGALSGDVTLSLTSPVLTSRGGAGTNLSVTGPGFLRQVTTGANVTVSTFGPSDLPTSGTWTLTGALNVTGANVGIGTPSPAHTLDVTGDLGVSTIPVNVSPGNGQAWGITITGQVAGETLTAGNVVYLYTDGKWYKAKADAVATSGPVELGIVPASITSGATGTVLIDGVVQIAGWSLSTGGFYYIDDGTSGGLTAIVPSTTGHQVRGVGHALAATILHFHPSLDWGEVQ